MAESDDQVSRLQEYQKRLEEFVESARGEVERQAPEVLDKLAAAAKNVAQRFEDMASDARQRAEETEAAPKSEPPPGPADAPPASSGESGGVGPKPEPPPAPTPG
jgi:hypothetical protein